MHSNKDDKDMKRQEWPEEKTGRGLDKNTSDTDGVNGNKAEDSKEGAAEAKKGEKIKESEMITLKTAEYEKLKETARLNEEFKDKYLRAHAELDNARKRLVKETQEYIKFANEDLLSEILYVVDNFDRGVEHINSTQKIESILEGIKMIQKQFRLFLERNGVKKIEAIGKRFDPTLHEAIEHIETDGAMDGIVIAEVQPGYLLNGKLLRAAAVKVGKKKEQDKVGKD